MDRAQGDDGRRGEDRTDPAEPDGPTQRLDAAPRLGGAMARGVLGAVRKRGPYDEAKLPGRRTVLAGVRIDERRLRAYAEVCGFRRPEGGAGGEAALPATYPHLLGFPLAMRLMASPDFPYPLLGLVHTGVELTQHRALRVSDRPDIAVYAEGPWPHRRGSRFGMVTEARLGGEPVWHSRSTYLCRHRTDRSAGGPGGQTGAVPESPPDTGPEALPEAPPAREEWRPDAGLGRRYAAVSGDRNPIHLHPLTARPFGFRRNIAHGMWTFARCLAEMCAEDAPGRLAGGPPHRPEQSEQPMQPERLTATAEFRAPLALPSTVVFHADGPTGPGGGPRRFEVRPARGAAESGPGRAHLTGEVSSDTPSSGSPGPPSRSS